MASPTGWNAALNITGVRISA